MSFERQVHFIEWNFQSILKSHFVDTERLYKLDEMKLFCLFSEKIFTVASL